MPSKTEISALLLFALLIGCSGSSSDPGEEPGSLDALYAIGSSYSTPAGRSTYLTILPSLDPSPAELDLSNAYEYPSDSDFWVLDGYVYTTNSETLTVAKNSVSDAGELIEEDVLSFAAYGVPSPAFWANLVISNERAYVANGMREFVVWNPTTMEITGTVDLPELEIRDGLLPTFGTGDRATVVVGNKVFQPVYWTDLGFARRSADSIILVIDTETESVVETISAPCPGLAYGTVDESGTIYFSTWWHGVGATLVLDQPQTCGVAVDSDTMTVTEVLRFPELTDGRQAAGMRYVGDGNLVFSVFHHDEIDLQAAIDLGDPFEILRGNNWRLWSFDPTSGNASVVDSTPPNSGGVYWFDVDGRPHALLANGFDDDTRVYRFNPATNESELLFNYPGWALRLFRIR